MSAKSALKGAAKLAAFALFLLALCELSARAYLSLKDGIPFFSPASGHIYRYYPALKSIDDDNAPPAPGEVRVLLLGASVLHNPLYDAGAVVQTMLEANPKLAGRKIRVYNLAVEGHTSLDSYYKYLHLMRRGRRFDAVIVYDAINELRANNCPPEMFRQDYSHYAWYDEVNFYHRWEAAFHAGFYFPYFFYIAARRVEARFNPRIYVPRERPRPEWYKYGEDIKSAAPFKRNLELIAGLAANNHQTLILSTFAYYLPPDYSLDKLKARTLPGTYVIPVEMWGSPRAVVKGLGVHNNIIRQIANEQHTIRFLDEEKNIPPEPRWFIDICHLSPDGVTRLSWDFSNAVVDIVAGKR